MLTVAMRAGARVVGDFPPPEGYGAWNREAISEAVGALFEAKPHLLTKALANGVADDGSLEAFLLVAMKRHLIDEAKATELGKMRRRFEKLLGRDPRFVFVSAPVASWALVQFAESVWPDDLDVLRAAAARVRGVYIVALNKAGPTPKKVADPLREVAAAVLSEACGAVPAQDLARVVLERFFPGEQPLEYVDEPGHHEGEFADETPGPDFEILIESAAEWVFASLTVAERALVPRLGEAPAERVGVLEDTGPAEAEALAASLREKIARAILDDGDAEQVVLTLGNLCRERP